MNEKDLRYENSKLRDENLTLNRRNQVLLLEIDTLRTKQSELTFYTIQQAADVLQLSYATVKRMIADRKIRAFQSEEGGAIRISHKDLMAFVVENTRNLLEVCEC